MQLLLCDESICGALLLLLFCDMVTARLKAIVMRNADLMRNIISLPVFIGTARRLRIDCSLL
jgi:hypothetical protein